MSTPSLPDYPSGSSSDSQHDASQDLPTYTRTNATEWDIPPADQRHSFHLESNRTGAQWLILQVVSRAASESDQPTFYQGGNVTGTLQLTLDKPEAMDRITIDVSNAALASPVGRNTCMPRPGSNLAKCGTCMPVPPSCDCAANVTPQLYGRLTIFSHTTANFLHVSRTLFAVAAQNPLQSLLKRVKLNAGQHEWPYSFHLPKGVNILSSIDMEGQPQRQSYRLPPSFSDPGSKVHIEYSLVVRVVRGGFRSGSKCAFRLTCSRSRSLIFEPPWQACRAVQVRASCTPQCANDFAPTRIPAEHQCRGTRRRSRRMENVGTRSGRWYALWFDTCLCTMPGTFTVCVIQHTY